MKLLSRREKLPVTYSGYRALNRKNGAPKSNKPYAMIEGDRVGVICRTTGNWKLTQASSQHKASETVLKKNVLAIVLTAYTTVKSQTKPVKPSGAS